MSGGDSTDCRPVTPGTQTGVSDDERATNPRLDAFHANPGDTWSTAGGLPSKEVFNRQNLGLMLAATLDVELL
jgi:hypothetical protein